MRHGRSYEVSSRRRHALVFRVLRPSASSSPTRDVVERATEMSVVALRHMAFVNFGARHQRRQHRHYEGVLTVVDAFSGEIDNHPKYENYENQNMV